MSGTGRRTSVFKERWFITRVVLTIIFLSFVWTTLHTHYASGPTWGKTDVRQLEDPAVTYAGTSAVAKSRLIPDLIIGCTVIALVGLWLPVSRRYIRTRAVQEDDNGKNPNAN